MADDMRRQDPPAPDSIPYATPLWVKVFGTIVSVVILLFIILRFTVFADH